MSRQIVQTRHALLTRHSVLIFLIFLYIVLSYGPEIQNVLLGIDDLLTLEYVRDHPAYAGLFYTPQTGPWFGDTFYRPFFILKGWLYYQLFGLNYGAYQVIEMLQHTLAAVFFYIALYRLTHNKLLSVIAVLVFATHTYVAAMTVFMNDASELTTILFPLVLLWVLKPSQKRGWYAVLFVLLLLAAFARENGLAIAGGLMVYAVSRFWFDASSRRRAVWILLTSILATAVYLILRSINVGSTAYISDDPADNIRFLRNIGMHLIAHFFPVFDNEGMLWKPTTLINIASVILILIVLFGVFFVIYQQDASSSDSHRPNIIYIGSIIFLLTGVLALVYITNPAIHLTRPGIETPEVILIVYGVFYLVIAYALFSWPNWSLEHKTIVMLALGVILANSVISYPGFRLRYAYMGMMGWILLVTICIHNLPTRLWQRHIRASILVVVTAMILVSGHRLNLFLPRSTAAYFDSKSALCNEVIPRDFAILIVEEEQLDMDFLIECRASID